MGATRSSCCEKHSWFCQNVLSSENVNSRILDLKISGQVMIEKEGVEASPSLQSVFVLL